MNLETALKEFRRGKKSYSASDIAAITEIVTALGVGNSFIVKDDYIKDPADVIHIHPRMVVASRSFPRSINRGVHPYPVHRFFCKLSSWR